MGLGPHWASSREAEGRSLATPYSVSCLSIQQPRALDPLSMEPFGRTLM